MVQRTISPWHCGPLHQDSLVVDSTWEKVSLFIDWKEKRYSPRCFTRVLSRSYLCFCSEVLICLRLYVNSYKWEGISVVIVYILCACICVLYAHVETVYNSGSWCLSSCGFWDWMLLISFEWQAVCSGPSRLPIH